VLKEMLAFGRRTVKRQQEMTRYAPIQAPASSKKAKKRQRLRVRQHGPYSFLAPGRPCAFSLPLNDSPALPSFSSPTSHPARLEWSQPSVELSRVYIRETTRRERNPTTPAPLGNSKLSLSRYFSKTTAPSSPSRRCPRADAQEGAREPVLHMRALSPL